MGRETTDNADKPPTSAQTFAKAAKAARLIGRAVLIEITALAEEWAMVFKGRPVLGVLPADSQHPDPQPRSAMR